MKIEAFSGPFEPTKVFTLLIEIEMQNKALIHFNQNTNEEKQRTREKEKERTRERERERQQLAQEQKY